ncbi:hypothetical protein SSPO_047250 [Streptomyces antimycoticus]|uniref:Uncharacterized protein n=1 Tax=Streptomyces antimycoticus TaxID=68175 RepID=A0A499V788_9ACTN|nr:hypothetical protein SSPO_047250 [Streptomyces antimycoticus]
MEVDALAGGDVHRGHHVGDRALVPVAQPLDGLLLAHPVGQLPSDEASEDQVGRLAEDLRTRHRERDAARAQREDQQRDTALGTEPGQQPAAGAPEVQGPLGRLPAHEAAGSGGGRRAPAGCRGAAHAVSLTFAPLRQQLM